MKKMGVWVLAVSLLTLTGCATTQRRPDTTHLQMRIGQLEQEVNQRDSAIQSLEQEIKTLSYEVERLRSQAAKAQTTQKAVAASEDKKNLIRVPVAVDKVQSALKNSGHYQGKIDGKAGAQTEAAISAFQKDKGLKIDGVVGQQTWTELEKHL